MAKCKRCGCEGLVWRQSKKGNWYLGVEQLWQGSQYGKIRAFYPAHRCREEIQEEPRERDACYWADQGQWRGP